MQQPVIGGVPMDERTGEFVVDLAGMRHTLEEMTAETDAETGPDAGRTTARVLGRIVRNTEIEVRAGTFTFRSDEPAGRGGRGGAPRPLQYFTAGVAT